MKQISNYIRKLLKGVGFMVLPIFIVVAFSLVIVLPVWYFADKFPNQYTFVVLGFFSLMLIFFAIQKIVKSLKSNKENFFRGLLKFVLFVVFFSFAVFALFKVNRLVALLFFLAPFVVFLLLDIFKPAKTEKSSS